MGSHRLSPTANRVDEGRRAAVVIGVVGLLVVAMVMGVWWFVAAGSGIRTQKATAYATVSQSSGSVSTAAATVPTDVFVVPTPTFITPSLTAPLGPLEPALPPEATLPVIHTTAKPVVTQPPPPPPPPAPTATPGVKVSNVALTCSALGPKVRATVAFTGSGTVPVSVTAGTVTVSEKLSGPYRLSATDDKSGRTASCSAVVNGVGYGPIPAR